MTFENLLNELAKRSIQIRRDGEQIKCRGNKNVIDAGIREYLSLYKSELIELLHEETDKWYIPRVVIRPEQLSLITLTEKDLDKIIEMTPGGVFNIQDIYSLAPLQEGILFHHLIGKRDAYVVSSFIAFKKRELLDNFLSSFQSVINRHDILRTAILWENLPEPVQVVWRNAEIPIEEVLIEPSASNALEQMMELYTGGKLRIDIGNAPMMRVFIARDDKNDRWILTLLHHHLIMDETSFDILLQEIGAHIKGVESLLPEALPFRNYIAQARLGIRQEEHKTFFRDMLSDFEEPTAPYGLLDVRGDGSDLEDASYELDIFLSRRLRDCASKLRVSAASVFHLAWAKVLGSLSNRDDVVFGTLLFGRMQGGEGAERVMGIFINTLPIRIEVNDDGIEEAVRKTHDALIELLQHEHSTLSLAQRCSGVTPPMPLFSSLLNYHYKKNIPVKGEESKRLGVGIDLLYSEGRTNYPFVLSVNDLGEVFTLTSQVQRPIDPNQICKYMNTVLKHFADALENRPLMAIGSVDVLSQAELNQILYEWNETDAEYSKDKCINELFEKQVEITPDIVAVVFENEQISYRELNRRANQLAHYLVELGVKPDSLVAIGVERSIEMVMGILSILKAGGAYVPLDPGYPIDRLSYIIKDSAPMALLTHSSLKDRWCDLPESIPVIEVDSDTLLWEGCSSSNPKNLGFTSDCLAYVIYTSGSTGTPKGVMVEHGNVVRLFSTTEEWYHFAANDIWTLFHSYAFDFSVWEIWGALLYGGRLVVVGQILSRSPEEFYQLLCQQEVTILNQTPSAFRQVIDAQAGSMQSHVLRKVIFGGEALEVGILKPWFERNDTKETQLINMYGITETTVHVTYHPLDPIDTKYYVDSPIGSRIPDLYIYILDANGKPVPIGVAGELYIGGAGVARGYLNMPDLTVERFMPDPFTKKPDARMYKTGDLGKWVPDGTIEFLGRNDFQVKIRGFRIELGEIESRLSEVEGVKEVVVLAREDIPGEKRLIAYYTVRETSEEITAEDMRSSLANQVPEYMLPSAYMALEEIPLTPNGKIDHKALPAPDDDAYSRGVYEAPVGKVEEALSRIWSELLNVEQVGRHDNFFELGGHSLLAVQLIERLRRNGLKTDVQSLFTSSTLKDLAVIIGKDETSEEVPPNLILPDCDSLTPDLLPLVTLEQGDIDQIIRATPGGVANIQDIYPLAPLQEGIFFHYLMGGESDPYVVLSLWAFECRELLDGFLTAFQSIIDRHDILRTAVLWEDLPEPVQVVWRKATLPIEEVLLDPSAGDAADQMRERFSRGNFRMDIRKAPMMHTFIARDDRDGRWLFAWLSHHLIDDNTTMKIFSQELDAYLAGEESSLPAALPFRNYVAQTRLGVSHEEHEAFFREMLSDVEEPTAPYGLLDVRGDGSDIEEATYAIETSLSMRIRDCGKKLRVSTASLFHLAWARLLSSLSNCDDVVFGTLLFGRMQGGEGADRVMGMFINTLPVRIHVKDDGVEDAIKKTHRMLAELLKHEHASLALAQRCSGVVSPMPLFTSLLNYRNIKTLQVEGEENSGVRIGIEELYSEERSNYPFTLSVNDLEEGYSLTAQVQRPIDPYQVCRYMNTVLENLADALGQVPQTAIGSIEVLREAERRKVLYDWNVTTSKNALDKCIHELFEEQVEKTPEAIAILIEDEQISYRELNRRSNQLAYYLRSIGIKPDDTVGICIERSLDVIICFLGILKAGGTCLPFEKEIPSDRIITTLNDSNCRVLLTKKNITKDVPFSELQNLQYLRTEDFVVTKQRSRIQALDTLPFPDRSTIDSSKFNKFIGQACVKDSILILSSRGCPYGCIYCDKIIWGRKYFHRSAENIFDEVQNYYQMGYRKFVFADDIFNLNRQNSEKFFKLIIKNNLKVHFLFPSGLRGDILSPEYIDLMSEAGVIQFVVALETASPRLQKLIKKNLNIEKLKENIDYICKEHPHIILDLFTMIGFPTETEEEALMTFDFIRDIEWIHFPYVNILKIIPGTEMATFALDHGITIDDINRNGVKRYHEIPNYIPFAKSFVRKYQSQMLSDYFLLPERLMKVLEIQKQILTHEEIIDKYNSYLPGGLKKYPEIMNLIGNERFSYGSDKVNNKIESIKKNNSSLIQSPFSQIAGAKNYNKEKNQDRKLRILLLDLSQRFSHEIDNFYDVVDPPLGLMYLMTYLNQNFAGRILGKIQTSRVDFDSFSALKDIINDFKPDVIGLRTLNCFKDFFHQTVSLLRHWGLDTPIIVGGPYASSNYSRILSDTNVDICVLGEGEVTFSELINAIIENDGCLPNKVKLSQIDGLAFVPKHSPTQERLASNRKVIMLDELSDINSCEDTSNLLKVNHSLNTSYTIYTSGSTGKPKGVNIPHIAIANHCYDIRNVYQIDHKDSVYQFASFGVDASWEQIFITLISGAKLILRGKDILSAEDFKKKILNLGITVINITPAYWSPIIQEWGKADKPILIKNLRLIIIGGEILPAKSVRTWEQTSLSSGRLLNAYGPTETTITSTIFDVTTRYGKDEYQENIPIGHPIQGRKIYILDRSMGLLPIGAPGELYIGGDKLAQGYLYQPDLTSKQFIPDLFSSEFGARLYKTGDLARYLPNGNIEFIDRIDHQVKIRGFRIELGEIESVILGHHGVRECLVIGREDKPGDKRLVAYIVSSQEQPYDVGIIRGYLKEKLPNYMIPSAYVVLKAIPLTQNGKTDHKALPAPEGGAYERSVYEAPVGEVEETLSRIWGDVLNVERVGRYDNFFDLGGHSLLAITLIARMRRKGLNTDVRALFTSSTLKDLAALVNQDYDAVDVPPNLIQANSDQITPDMLTLITLNQEGIDCIIESTPGGAGNIQDIYPLAPLQEGILFHHLVDEERDAYVSSSLMAFKSRELLDNFLRAAQSVIDRHDILRTAILWEGLPEPVQVVWRNARMSVEEVTIDTLEGALVDQMMERYSGGKSLIDIRRAPMIHAFIARDDSSERWILTLLSHHLIMDHATLEILFKEIEAHFHGRESLLPEALPFRNYVAQTRLGVSHEEHEAFFREMLSDVVEPTAPYGLLDVRGNGSDIEEALYVIDIALSLRLRDCARKLRVSVASIFHLVWARVLGSLSNRDDVVFGTVLFGRMQGGEGADRVMGMFINTLPVRIDVKDDGVEETIKKTHRMLAELLKHEHASLALAQRCSGVVSPMPLFTSLLNYRHIQPMSSPFKEANAPRRGMQLLFSEERTNYPLALSVNDLGEGYSLTAQVQRPIDPYQVCRYMNTALEHIADALENEPLMAVGSVDVLSEAELHQLLYEWNNTAVEYPKDKCIHKLFEDQATRTPDAIAVIFENDHISYRELNRRTNQLGHYLRSLGVSPDVPVGIYLDKSLEMIIGILGALKAGGAYVPLDPEYPEERLAFILVDSNISVLLSMERLATLFSEAADKESFLRRPILLCLDTDWKNIAKESEDASVVVASSQNSAYILYTSGSTGKPKGVIGYHQGLCNLASDQYRRLDVKPDSRILQFASLNFDASTWEIILALCSGATLCMAQKDLLLPGATLEKLMNKLIITHVLLPPSALALMHPKEMETVNAMVVGGEACSNELACFWYDKLRFFNAYGPTESTVIATMVEYSNIVSKFSIGRAINNTKIYILDPQIHPVLLKVSGELHIGGDGLSYGYLNQMELTAEKFIPEPFGNRPGSRLYKTGDLARYLEDGNIEFIGRIDDQVKIRGFRIELGEIESDILEYSGVKEVVILAREDRPGDKRLVAYIVSSHGELPDAVEIRNYLKTKLPDYMIPSAFVMLDEMPLTPNGKIDRKALPAPEGSGLEKEYVAPRTENEKQLAEIWSEVLGVERVGIYDNFFEIGGDSILSIQVVARLRKRDLEITPKDLFQNQSIYELAAVVKRIGIVDAEQDLVTGSAPLTPIQHWFFEQELTEVHHFNQAMMLEVPPDIDSGLLRQSVEFLMRYHDVLRLRFDKTENGWGQRFSGVKNALPFMEADLDELSPNDQIELLHVKANELQASLNLSEGPLIRTALLRMGQDSPGRLLIIIHHLAVDIISWRILLDDLRTIYEQLNHDDDISILPKSTSFKQWSERLLAYAQSDKISDEIPYWLNKSRQEVSSLPIDFPLNKDQNTMSSASVIQMSLSEEKTDVLLHRIPEVYNTQINDILLTVLAMSFSEWTGERNLLIDLEGHGREELFDDADLSRTVGWFTSIYPLLISLPDSNHEGKLLKSVKEQIRGVPSNGIGYGLLRYLSADTIIHEKLRRLPQAEVSFNYLGQLDIGEERSSMFTNAKESSGRAGGSGNQRSHLIDIVGSVSGGSLSFGIGYCRKIHRKETIEKLALGFKEKLESIITHCLSPEAGGYTPSDFPLVAISQDMIDEIIGNE